MALGSQVSDHIVQLIAYGALKENVKLPSEAELGETLGMSRLTIREALKVLESQGIVTAVQGKGTLVNPISDWTSVCAISTVLAHRNESTESALQLLDVRRMLEIGATERAATHRSDTDLEELHVELHRMKTAHFSNNTDEFASADIDFHEIILRASGNILLPALMAQLRPLLIPTRRETSAHPQIRSNAILAHAKILAELSSQDVAAARTSMREHMDQTIADLQLLAHGGLR